MEHHIGVAVIGVGRQIVFGFARDAVQVVLVDRERCRPRFSPSQVLQPTLFPTNNTPRPHQSSHIHSSQHSQNGKVDLQKHRLGKFGKVWENLETIGN